MAVQKVVRDDAEWRSLLTREQYRVCRLRETEPAFANRYHDCREAGVYRCACCGLALFSSDAKFDSGTGWPSFSAPVDAGHIETAADNTHGMSRTEVSCAACGAHLGHVLTASSWSMNRAPASNPSATRSPSALRAR